MKVRHICEVCDAEVLLTPDEGHEAGWDYPPKMGVFGVVSPRTCPNCSMAHTLWWAVAVDGFTVDMLTPRQVATLARIHGEPDNIVVPDIDDAPL